MEGSERSQVLKTLEIRMSSLFSLLVETENLIKTLIYSIFSTKIAQDISSNIMSYLSISTTMQACSRLAAVSEKHF